MPDYRETTLEGKTWYRAYSVQINNPYQQVPKVYVHEQKATKVGMDTTLEDVGFISAEYNPAESFDLLNPETGEILGSVTQADLYQILHSLYLHLAKQRDIL